MVTELNERIENKLDENEMDRKTFVREMGYENMTKGLRRLDSWRNGEDWPESEDQVERLSRLLPATSTEIQRLIEWEKQKEKLERLEERREDPRSFLVVQTSKFSSKSKKFPGEQDLEDVKRDAKQFVVDAADEYRNEVSDKFLGILNTPECRNYYIDEEGEITSIRENSVSLGGPHLAVQ